MEKEVYFKIERLKQLLAKEDYKTIKYIQGELTEEEFAEVKAQCKAWRDEINQLEQEESKRVAEEQDIEVVNNTNQVVEDIRL